MQTEETKHENADQKKPKDTNGEHDLAKGNQPNVQKKPDDERVKTVTPDNDSGDPGPPVEERS